MKHVWKEHLMWKAKIDEESESPLPNCQEASCIPFQETIRIFRNTATKMNMPETLKFSDLWMSSVPPFKSFSLRFRFNLFGPGLAILGFKNAKKQWFAFASERNNSAFVASENSVFYQNIKQQKNSWPFVNPATSNDLIWKTKDLSELPSLGTPKWGGGKLGTLVHCGEGDWWTFMAICMESRNLNFIF